MYIYRLIFGRNQRCRYNCNRRRTLLVVRVVYTVYRTRHVTITIITVRSVRNDRVAFTYHFVQRVQPGQRRQGRELYYVAVVTGIIAGRTPQACELLPFQTGHRRRWWCRVGPCDCRTTQGKTIKLNRFCFFFTCAYIKKKNVSLEIPMCITL